MSDLSSFTPNRPPRRGPRGRYVLLTILVLVLGLLASQVFLHQTSVGSPRFVGMTFILWAGTLLVSVALLVLATVLGRNLIKLHFERKSGQLGSGFKAKMVSTFVALSLLPALLLFFLAYGLISVSIEQWFSAPAAQMMDYSRGIAEQYYKEMEQRSRLFAGNIAKAVTPEDLSDPAHRPDRDRKLKEYIQQFGLRNVELFDRSGHLLVRSGEQVAQNNRESHVQGLITDALALGEASQVERISPEDPLTEVSRAAAVIRDANSKPAGVILTEAVNAGSARFKVSSVIEAFNAYRDLQQEKMALRFNFLLILALSTLLIVFVFSWFAMYLAKRITVPIQALAEGAAAVATGDLDHRVRCEAYDELGSLVASFNRMTSDLGENKNRIEAAQNTLRRTNEELDNRRRYIETILQTISAGVISLDENYRVRTINRAALQMFETQNPAPDAPLEEVIQGPGSENLKALLQKASVLGPIVRNIELPLSGKTLHLATTVTPLVDQFEQRTGWVVVLDDVTEILNMEKMTAWQEVARRLAHEIKNPLTPIQLSAERIQKRFREISVGGPPVGPLTAERAGTGPALPDLAIFEKLLNECVGTIIQEAGSLKNLVDEFSRFARLPGLRLESTNVHRVIENTLGLYNGRIQGVRIEKNFDARIPDFAMDPEQMKRVFINLFDNALEAMAGNPQMKTLRIRTSRQSGSVRIEISDTGRGFPREYQDSMFLPYFSTRKGGTGLGLAIVRQIVTDHHGQVRAEANQPLGTRIVIDLPLAPA